MRATYLVNHIEDGTPVVELMRIAGVQSLDALAGYVRLWEGRPKRTIQVDRWLGDSFIDAWRRVLDRTSSQVFRRRRPTVMGHGTPTKVITRAF
jgi:hypothetical protein